MRAYINVGDFISCWWQFVHVKDWSSTSRIDHNIVSNIDLVLSVWSSLVYIVIVHWLWYINIYSKQYTFHCIFYSDTINMFDKHACNSSLVFYYEIITVVKVNANAALDSRIFIEQRSSKFITVIYSSDCTIWVTWCITDVMRTQKIQNRFRRTLSVLKLVNKAEVKFVFQGDLVKIEDKKLSKLNQNF